MLLMGYLEHYNRHMAEALTDLLGFRRIGNDIVIYDGNDHIAHVREFVGTVLTSK